MTKPPPPPGFRPTMKQLETAAAAPASPAPLVVPQTRSEVPASFKVAPNLPSTAALTTDDVSFILDNELKSEHRVDPRVIAFISSYVVCRDLRQAGRESGVGYVGAKTLYNRKDINRAISKITDCAINKYGLDASEVVEKVKEVAYIDPAMLFKPDGACIENMHDIPAEARRAIKKFEVKNVYGEDINGMPTVVGKLMKIEMWDKLKANELLGREMHLFTETTVVKHDVTENMGSILLESKARADARAIAHRELLDVTPGKPDDSSGT